MTTFSNYTVIYDITNNKERTSISKTLKDYGFRIQRSVFECKLTVKDRNELIQKLENLNIQTGFIKIYRMVYQSNNNIIGKNTNNNIDDGPAFII